MIPILLESDKNLHFELAFNSIRKRSPKILHEKGDYLNKVFNFVLSDSYMHPHLHPGKEKIEKMYLLQGAFALILFDDNGDVDETIILEEGKREFVEVPSYTWHTYVMLSDKVIIYETMEGVYDVSSWKKMAPWAPKENTPEADNYLAKLKVNLSG
jgi:cupin fold WbuC family metalloprotein